jgi:hypothetical protein
LAQLGLLLAFRFVGGAPMSAIGLPFPGSLRINAILTALAVPLLGLP